MCSTVGDKLNPAPGEVICTNSLKDGFVCNTVQALGE